MATGTASRNAIRPDHRCNAPIHDGAAMPGTFPYITSAETSWTTANVAAPVVSHVLAASGPEKPAMLPAMFVGSCSFPYTPSATATAAPIATGTSSFTAPPDGGGACGG